MEYIEQKDKATKVFKIEIVHISGKARNNPTLQLHLVAFAGTLGEFTAELRSLSYHFFGRIHRKRHVLNSCGKRLAKELIHYSDQEGQIFPHDYPKALHQVFPVYEEVDALNLS